MKLLSDNEKYAPKSHFETMKKLQRCVLDKRNDHL